MAGVKALRRILIGKETTAGTAVAATTQWRGNGTIQDNRPVTFSDEDIGVLAGPDHTYIPYVGATLSMEPVVATFEQFPHILNAGVKAVTTGTTEGSGWIYVYPVSTSSQQTIKTYTIEGGDDQQAEEMEYSFVKTFTLSGQAQQAMMMGAEWTGRQVTNTTFTASTAATLPSVEDVLFQKGKIYVDAVSGTAGTTQLTNTLLQYELSVATGWMEVFTGDGNLYYSFTKMTRPAITARMTFEHDATSVAEKTNWRNQTARLIRFQVDGSALTTAGTNFSTKAIRVDLAGKWLTFDKIGERNGNDVITATFNARYNTTANQYCTITVCNGVNALP